MVRMTLFALTTAATAAVAQQTPPAWRFTSPDTIGAVEVTPLGGLAVLTGHRLIVLDISTGEAAWQRSDVRAFDIIGGTPYGIVRTAIGFELVDFATGLTLWSLRVPPIDTVRSYVAMPEHQQLLIYGTADTSQLVVLAVGLERGDLRWMQNALFNAPEKLASRRRAIRLADATAPLWDSDTTVVLYPSHGGPIKLDARTGHLLWRLDTLRHFKPPAWADGYSPMLADGGKIYIPYGQSLAAVDAATGQLLWQQDWFPGLIAQMEMTPRGLLVRGRYGAAGTSFLDLLDTAVGDARWAEQAGHLDYATRFTIIEDTAFLAANGRLLGVNVGTGQVLEFATLAFEGGDVPYDLEAGERGFQVVGSQNISLIERQGRQIYRLYYPAVGASPFAKIFSTTLIFAVNAASIATARRGQGVMLVTNNPILGIRHHASRLAEAYHFIFTSQKDDPRHEGFSIVRIDKTIGLERGRVRVMDRTPQYLLDPASATLILRLGKRELQALRF